MQRVLCVVFFFFFQAEDGIRDLVRSRGLGDVYKRQSQDSRECRYGGQTIHHWFRSWYWINTFEYRLAGDLEERENRHDPDDECETCLLYTSDAADERSKVDLGGRRLLKKKNQVHTPTYKEISKK